jgi:hypothetical protein
MDNPPFVPKLKTLVPYLKANPPSDRQRNVLLAQYAAPNRLTHLARIVQYLPKCHPVVHVDPHIAGAAVIGAHVAPR